MSVIEDSQHLKTSLEEQLRFERLLTELSTTFISLPASEVDKAIELPPEASQERASFEEMGLKSVLLIPHEMGDVVIGGLTLSTLREEHTWPETLIPPLKQAGRILAHALRRKRAGLERQSLVRQLNEPLTAILSNAQAAQRFLT